MKSFLSVSIVKFWSSAPGVRRHAFYVIGCGCMKFICGSILCVMVSTIGRAQSQQSVTTEIILYKDYYFLNSPTTFRFSDYDPDIFNDYGYGIALHKRLDDRRYRQFEAKVFLNTSTSTTEELKQQAFQINYKRGKYWKRNLFKTIRPRHSMSLHLDFFREDSAPLIASQYPVERISYGIGLDYLIGIEIPLTKKINFHIDSSLITVSFRGSSEAVRNPTQPVGQQKQSGFDFNLGGQRVLKLGLGFEF